MTKLLVLVVNLPTGFKFWEPCWRFFPSCYFSVGFALLESNRMNAEQCIRTHSVYGGSFVSQFMDAAGEAISCRESSGYGKPPWKFKGSAVYQFHLVKAEIARALTPKEFTLVEAFGYTLGGFFLAKYNDSPVGAFDELVVIAGLVWNPPTSCAWAAKVLVNNLDAWSHGRKHVGLPSHVASFSELGCCPEQTALPIKGKDNPRGSFLSKLGMSPGSLSRRTRTQTQVTEVGNSSAADIFSINMISSAPDDYSRTRMGPLVKMSLPSFSGRTEDNPSLLKYSCQMQCRVRILKAVDIRPSSTQLPPTPHLRNLPPADTAYEELEGTRSRLSLLVMLSKPVLALEFRNMEFDVEAPLVVAP
ncbi:hypothetical protein Droror1_Dr00008002 [Drosera rotundifolia]